MQGPGALPAPSWLRPGCNGDDNKVMTKWLVIKVISKLLCGDDGDGGVFMTVTKIMVVEVGGDGVMKIT